MPDDFEQMWARARARSAARPPAAATSGSRSPRSSPSCARGSSSSARARGLVRRGRRQRQPARLVVPRRTRRRRPTPDAVLVGSHLDSVLDGGAYDGPLGVVSLAGGDRPAPRARRGAGRPVVVGAFAEEEGSRFGLACLGSRLATGTTTPGAGAGAARPRRRTPARRDGRPAASSRRSAGPPGSTGSAASSSCTSSRVATSSTATPRSGLATRDLAARALPLRLHRRGQPRRAPPGWRTGTTRCSATR